LWVEVLVLLLANLDGVAEADLLERLVPLQDALLDVGAVLLRHRLLHPEYDLLLGLHELAALLPRRAVGALQAPAVDEAIEGGVAVVAGVVLDDAKEVPDAVVGEPWGVMAVGHLTDAVVDDDGGGAVVDDVVLGGVAGVGGGDLQLEVLREGLDLVPGAAIDVEVAAVEAGE